MGETISIFAYAKIYYMQRIKNIEKRVFIIYVLKCPDTKNIRYVGVTCGTLRNRLHGHMYDAKKGGTPKRNWINSLAVRPIIEQIEICTYKNWENRERYWISYYENLTNVDLGGSGCILDRSKDSIKRSSEAKYVPVVSLDIQGNVKRYKSFKEAVEKTGIPRTSIQYSMQSLDRSSYGFKFFYEKDYYPGVEKLISIKPRKHKYIITHMNIKYTPTEFALKLNISETPIYLICEGKRNWKNSSKYDNTKLEIVKI